MSITDVPKSGFAKQEDFDKDEDWISQLPDDILLDILSRLTLKEEAIMCGISKRWRCLWSHIYALNFDATKIFFDITKIFFEVEHKRDKEEQILLLNEKRSWFINWVDQILKSHEGLIIDEFRIRFDFDNRFAREIDGWLDFAISHRVKKLDLNLASTTDTRDASLNYTFSNDLYDRLKTPPGLLCVKSLTTLCLEQVNVTGEIIEHFLFSCPALERLIVDCCGVLESIKVVDLPSPLPLKHLEIRLCSQFKEVDITAPNLISFTYLGGEKIIINIRHSPLMVDLVVYMSDDPAFAFPRLSSYFCQLETLELCFCSDGKKFPDIPELSKLKHLTFTCNAEVHDSMLGIDPVIRASPCLHKLTLKVSTWRNYYSSRRVREKVVKSTHQYKSLKIVEVIGFTGSRMEFEILLFLIEKAILLEKVVIDRREYYSIGGPWEFEETKERQVAKVHALQLKQKLPPKIKLIIL